MRRPMITPQFVMQQMTWTMILSITGTTNCWILMIFFDIKEERI